MCPTPSRSSYIMEGMDEYTFMIHILVAKAFLPNDDPWGNQVNRKDLNPLNNKKVTWNGRPQMKQ